MIDGVDVATLGVKVTLDGAQQAAAGLDQVAASGAKAEQSTRSVSSATDGLTASQRFLMQQGLSLDAVLARVNGSSAALAVGAGQVTAAVQRQAATLADFARAGASAAQAAQMTGASLTEARAAIERFGGQAATATGEVMGLALAQKELAEAGIELSAANNMGNLQLGRLRQSFATMGAEALGIPTIFGRVGSTMASAFGVGSVAVIGVLAGISAISYAWKAMESDADKLADKVKEAMKKVHDATVDAQLGMGDLQLTAAEKAVSAAQRALTLAQSGQSGAAFAKTGLASVDQAQVEANKKVLDKALADLQYWQAQKTSIDSQMQLESERTDAQQLATLISTGHATSAERQRALDEYKRYEAEAAQLAQTQTDNVKRLADIQNAATLQSALFPKSSIPGKAGPDATVDQQKILTMLLKQLDEMRQVNAEDNKALALSDQAAKLATAEGYAKEYLTIQFQAENDTLEAYSKLAGPARTERLAMINATEAQAIATLNQKTATKDAQDAAQHFNEMTKQVVATGSANVKITQAQTDQYAKLGNTIEVSLLRSVEQFTSHGTLSWAAFFKTGESLSAHLLQQTQSDLDGMRKAHADALAKMAADKTEAARAQDAADAAKYAKDIANYEQYLKKLQALNAGMAGLAIGNSIAQATGSAGAGALGAAAGGAALGGPAGAFVSTLGYIGESLLTQSATNKEAWRQFEDARVKWADSLSKLVTSLSGTSLEKQQQSLSDQFSTLIQNALTDTENAIKGSPAAIYGASGVGLFGKRTEDIPGGLSVDPKNIDATIASIQALVGHGKNLAQNKELDALLAQLKAIDDQYVKQAAALAVLQAAASKAFESDLNIRNLRAASDVQAADDAARVAQNLKDQTDAENTFGKASQEVTDLLKTQAAEAKQFAAAQAEATAQITYTLDAREAYAKGLTAEGDAITRRAAEEKELFDDAAAGYTDEQLARVAYIQGLEDQAKAEADAKAALEKYTQSIADLTSQFLTLTGQTDAAAKATLAEQQRQATNQAIADKAPADQMALLGVVQLFQRGQLEAQQQIAHQTDTLNAQLKVQQNALSVAQSSLQALQQAASSLKTFDQSLNTGSLSPLSPIDQLNAAKAERDRLFAAAQGGDATAAGQYGAAAQSFLQLSQGYNASGAGYQSDFATTKQQADALSAQYDHQVSLQQQTVDALNAQIKVLQDQLTTLQNANTLTQMTRDAVIAELQRDRDAALVPNGAMIDQLNALRDTLSGVGRDIVSSERDILVGDQNTVNAATQAEINAINSGASAQQIATLDAVRQLELQKTAQDDYYANDLVETAKIYGWDSPQVKSIIDLQAKYDAGVQAQINAIEGIAPAIGGLINKAPGSIGVDRPPAGGPINPGTSPVGGTTPVSGTWVNLYDPYLPQETISVPAGTTSYTDILGDTWTAAGGWVGANGDGRLVGFANGGDFAGGLRLVGEMGPELEVTGPSRITSTASLLAAIESGGNNAELIAEVKALRSAVAALHEMNRVGANATIAGLGAVAQRVDANTDKTVRGLERITSKIA